MKSHEGIKQKYDQFSDKHPYAATMGETALLFGLRYALQKAGDKVGVPLGHGRKDNASINRFAEEHPVLAASSSTLGTPITEELIFRELPSRVLEKKGYDDGSLVSRRAKLAIAGIFAATHAGPDAIPVPQFIGGLNYNRIHKKRGVKASMLAHATNNALYVAKHVIEQKRPK